MHFTVPYSLNRPILIPGGDPASQITVTAASLIL